jgi:transitional endoplasmic reticulum ATPase
MVEDYARIQQTLKSEATRPTGGGIGFVYPGMLQPRNPNDGKG